GDQNREWGLIAYRVNNKMKSIAEFRSQDSEQEGRARSRYPKEVDNSANSVSKAAAYPLRDGSLLILSLARKLGSWYPVVDRIESDGKSPEARQDHMATMLDLKAEGTNPIFYGAVLDKTANDNSEKLMMAIGNQDGSGFSIYRLNDKGELG